MSTDNDNLRGRVAIVTGAGRGVGFETARALASLGARVVVAEFDEATGAEAAGLIRAEHGPESAMFVHTDVGDQASLVALVAHVVSERRRIDIVVNNATVAPFGPVPDVPLEDWDLSYRVNLRGPAALARLTVPGMVERGYGVFVCLSSVGGAYMAPYEALKAAQVELASTLAAELEGTGVFAFAIGPGQVMTLGLEAGVAKLAPLYGMSPDEFLAMNSANTIGAEEAGLGIAHAIRLAERFHGTETASIAGLMAAGIEVGSGEHATPTAVADVSEAVQACSEVRATFRGEVEGWRERGVFERRWMERDFAKSAGLRADDVLVRLDMLVECLQRGEADPGGRDLLERLRVYYDHYITLAKGYTKDPEQLRFALQEIGRMRCEIERAEAALGE